VHSFIKVVTLFSTVISQELKVNTAEFSDYSGELCPKVGDGLIKQLRNATKQRRSLFELANSGPPSQNYASNSS
jgi:hypothetical protein